MKKKTYFCKVISLHLYVEKHFLFFFKLIQFNSELIFNKCLLLINLVYNINNGSSADTQTG